MVKLDIPYDVIRDAFPSKDQAALIEVLIDRIKELQDEVDTTNCHSLNDE
jgi:hypothetical protein